MSEVVLGIILSAIVGWMSWASITIIAILRKLDILIYKVEENKFTNEKSGVSL